MHEAYLRDFYNVMQTRAKQIDKRFWMASLTKQPSQHQLANSSTVLTAGDWHDQVGHTMCTEDKGHRIPSSPGSTRHCLPSMPCMSHTQVPALPV